MSTLLRLVRSQGVKNGFTYLASKDAKICEIACRGVSSTPKKDDSAELEPYTVKKQWVSYGFSYENESDDRHLAHQSFFCGVSLLLVCGGFILAYMPDPFHHDWTRREAYLRLRHREENGLPLIDPNLIDPSKFTLPPEEEILNTEIVI